MKLSNIVKLWQSNQIRHSYVLNWLTQHRSNLNPYIVDALMMHSFIDVKGTIVEVTQTHKTWKYGQWAPKCGKCDPRSYGQDALRQEKDKSSY